MPLFGYGVQFLLSGVLPVFQNLSYNLQKILSDVLSIQQVTKRLYRDALAYMLRYSIRFSTTVLRSYCAGVLKRCHGETV